VGGFTGMRCFFVSSLFWKFIAYHQGGAESAGERRGEQLVRVGTLIEIRGSQVGHIHPSTRRTAGLGQGPQFMRALIKNKRYNGKGPWPLSKHTPKIIEK